MTDPKPHCTRCGRTIKPRWAIKEWAEDGEECFLEKFVGPTCRRKWIESGDYSESDFVDTCQKQKKN